MAPYAAAARHSPENVIKMVHLVKKFLPAENTPEEACKPVRNSDNSTVGCSTRQILTHLYARRTRLNLQKCYPHKSVWQRI